jgi:uncharacterized protein (TIGR02266 family)
VSDRDDARAYGRAHARAPVVMEVQYRSAGSFLVSYSLNLSRGGLFLEAEDPSSLPIDTSLVVRLRIPGMEEPVETTAKVAWARAAEGTQPSGVGLQFDSLGTLLGQKIDRLVRQFKGVHMTAVGGDTPSMTKLSRFMQSSITCQVEELTAREVCELETITHADLLLLDLDSTGRDGLRVIEIANHCGVPVVVLARSGVHQQQALAAGAAGVHNNPPPFAQLRRTLLDVLSRPLP